MVTLKKDDITYSGLEAIELYNAQLPNALYSYGVNRDYPFLFLDYEVYKNDWLVCFSTDGVHVKSIVNNPEQLKNLIINKLSNRIIIAYNGNGYDKFINLAILNGLNPKEVNDNIINNFNFNFNNEYRNQINIGEDLMWYDPSTRLGGSLKTYEACIGENIYETNVNFDLDRKLTPEEIKETIKYCSFDVEMLIKYFYEVNFSSFLGHVGLIDLTIKAKPFLSFNRLLARTDTALSGTYLCNDRVPVTTKPNDVIQLPKNIKLGKYEEQIKEFLKIPILTLKEGKYADLNSWSLNVIQKSIERCSDYTALEKLKSKEQKSIEKIKKIKIELNKLREKDKLTDKQKEKLETSPDKINNELSNLQEIRNSIIDEENLLNELKELKEQLDQYPDDLSNSNHNYILSKIIEKAKVTNNEKLILLRAFLNQSDEQLFDFKYKTDKKDTPYNLITIYKPFEMLLDIKGIIHAFKTGGLHSVHDKMLKFDKREYEGNDLYNQCKNKKMVIADVGSLYPNLMRVFGLCSKAMTDPNNFAEMIFNRIEYKKKKDPFANVLKLILNSTYGAMGAEFNQLYDPENRLKVCIYGESVIVDLLDKLENNVKSLEVYQTNTDGIIVACNEEEYDMLESTIHEWENRTGLEMEIDGLQFISQKDVSNYCAVFDNGKPKFKGGEIGNKNAFNNSLMILNKGLRNYLLYSKSIYDTINENQDLIDYQIVKKRSAKTKYMNFDDQSLLEDKVLRLFPVTKGGMRIVNDKLANVPDVPERSVLIKENIIGKTIKDIPDFDINYYINAFNDKLEKWFKGGSEDDNEISEE